jgi:predicted nucleic-acid-binding protein
MWADTNILVRLITKSPTAQYQAVVQFLSQVSKPVFVHPTHVCEAMFVLEGNYYNYSAIQATGELALVLSASCFDVIDATAIANTLRLYPESNLDFPDVLICELARVNNDEVLSFDRKMARLGVPIRQP